MLQAIDWIEELCDVMVRTHKDMGASAQEADDLQEDNRKFEATASVSISGEIVFFQRDAGIVRLNFRCLLLGGKIRNNHVDIEVESVIQHFLRHDSVCAADILVYVSTGYIPIGAGTLDYAYYYYIACTKYGKLLLLSF